jgi:hypothetical protein
LIYTIFMKKVIFYTEFVKICHKLYGKIYFYECIYLQISILEFFNNIGIFFISYFFYEIYEGLCYFFKYYNFYIQIY